MNRFIKVILLTFIYVFVFSATCFASFSDVENHWASKEIKDFEESKLVQGYADGTFKPDQDITRAEFCKIINSYMNYEVSGDWQQSNLDMAKEKGYLSVGKANDAIARDEAFVALARLMKLENKSNDELSFADSEDIAIWALPAIKALNEKGYIKGFPDSTIKPNQNMKRAELVAILYQYVGIGGVDIDEAQFAVGYMDHNDYGLEFKEIRDSIEIAEGDVLTLSATVAKIDGDAKFEVIAGADIVEFDEDFLTVEGLKEGTAQIRAVTTESKKEKVIEILVK